MSGSVTAEACIQSICNLQAVCIESVQRMASIARFVAWGMFATGVMAGYWLSRGER